MRFSECPSCRRLVSTDADGLLQAHDVPFSKRRNPKIPQACPTRTLAGNSVLEA